MKSTLICSTYNSPHFLELVLDSLLYQDTNNFELLIADDGSGEETKTLIDNFAQSAPFPVKHIWHEDKGWRKSQIHNTAIKQSSHEHLIFIDGDCVLEKCFISDHQLIFKRERENYILMGRRVELGPQITSALTKKNYRALLCSPMPTALYISSFKNDSRGVLRRSSIKSPILRKLIKADNVSDLLGCNFSLNKKTMILINGFNDDYERGEDGDIFVRIRNNNHKLIGMKYFAPMYHLFHPRGDYQYVDDHYEEILRKTDYLRCQNGLDKYLNSIDPGNLSN